MPWSPLRRARDNLKPHRPVSTLPDVLNAILDEIKVIKQEVLLLKKRK